MGKIDFNLPNVLTIGRVFAIPLLVFAMINEMKTLFVYTFIGACLTDYVDGYLARKWNITSAFGAFLDPVADKLMVATALVMLIVPNPQWYIGVPVAIIISREIGVSALREWMAERNQRASVQVGSLGKWKTAIQMVAISFLLEALPGSEYEALSLTRLLFLTPTLVYNTGIVLLYVATALTVISGYLYFAAAWPLLLADDVKMS